MTVKFNWMEHALEVMIELILGTDEAGLVSPLVDWMRFGTKADVLKELVEALSEHYVPTEENDKAYQHFVSAVKKLISQARQLNTFRNSIVHWRPFLRGSMPRARIDVSAKAIGEKADEMESVGNELFSRAVGVRQGDNALTFGRQFKQ